MNATALESEEEAESRRLRNFALILCTVYVVALLGAQYLGNHWIERERAKYFDLC